MRSSYSFFQLLASLKTLSNLKPLIAVIAPPSPFPIYDKAMSTVLRKTMKQSNVFEPVLEISLDS